MTTQKSPASAGFFPGAESGEEAFPEVTQPLFDEINEMYGTDVKPIFRE